MADNVYRKPPMGRIPHQDPNVADPDRKRKSQPNLLPIHGRTRGREPVKVRDISRRTMGVWIYASDRYALLRVMRRYPSVAIRFSKPFKVVKTKPIIQLFLSGATPDVVSAVVAIEATSTVLKKFNIDRPGPVRPPNIYRDKSVKERAR